MKLLTGNSNLPLAQAIAAYLEIPLTEASVRRFADEEVFVEIHENVRGEDVFVLQSTGYPANDNLMELLICIDALKRSSAQADHGGDPLFRLCPAGSETRPAHADLGQARRQPDHRRGRRPRALDGSPRRPDPGLLRYPDRQSLRRAGDVGRYPGALLRPQPDGRLARRRRRGARPRARQATRQRAARDRRQAPRAARRIGGDEHHRRRRRPLLHPRRRYRRFGRHAVQRRRRAARGGRRGCRRLCAATACSRAARWRGSRDRR